MQRYKTIFWLVFTIVFMIASSSFADLKRLQSKKLIRNKVQRSISSSNAPGEQKVANPNNKNVNSSVVRPNAANIQDPNAMADVDFETLMLLMLLSQYAASLGRTSRSNGRSVGPSGSTLASSPGAGFTGSGMSGDPSGASRGFSGEVVAAGNCASIYADCRSHTIIVKTKDGKTITDDINCGKPGNPRCGGTGETITGKGKVGGLHKGEVVPKGVDIVSPRMGQDGGGKVFHLPSPKGGGSEWGSGTPSRVNNTCGCIAVSLKMIETLNNCQGTPLEIIGTDKAGRESKSQAPSSSVPDARTQVEGQSR